MFKPLLNDGNFVASQVQHPQSRKAAHLGDSRVAEVVKRQVQLLQLVERVVQVGDRNVTQPVASHVQIAKPIQTKARHIVEIQFRHRTGLFLHMHNSKIMFISVKKGCTIIQLFVSNLEKKFRSHNV